MEQLAWLFKWNRKTAAEVNRELLDWLAHGPAGAALFRVPELLRCSSSLSTSGDGHPSIRESLPTTASGRSIDDPFAPVQTEQSPGQIAAARDSYDNCIAHLDEQLGRLVDELDRPGQFSTRAG